MKREKCKNKSQILPVLHLSSDHFKAIFIIQYINSDIEEEEKKKKSSCWHQDPEMLPNSKILHKKIHTHF